MTGVATDLPYESPGPEKPDESPEGYDLGPLSDEPTADPIVRLPPGVSGHDTTTALSSDDPADQRLGEQEHEQEVRAESVHDDLDEELFQDGPDESAAERAKLVAWLGKLAEADDRAFDASEQAEIAREAETLRAQVERLTELNREQQETIAKLLAEVQRGSKRMGRKDWATWAIGAATSLVIMELVPPLALLPLAAHAIHALGHLFIDA